MVSEPNNLLQKLPGQLAKKIWRTLIKAKDKNVPKTVEQLQEAYVTKQRNTKLVALFSATETDEQLMHKTTNTSKKTK